MSVANFAKTLSRPTFTLAWLSNNIDFSQVIVQPSLLSAMNFWNVNTTIGKPTIVFNSLSGMVYEANNIIIPPKLSAVLVSGTLATFSTSIKKPVLVAVISQESLYSLRQTINKFLLSASIALNGNYVFNTTLKPPTFVIQLFNEPSFGSSAQTYIFNTATGAHSEYTNFGFNSYFKLNNSYYGINSEGVFKLTGDLDGATTISAQVTLPLSSFDKQGLKSCSDAIVFGRIAGDMEIIAITDEQQERSFALRSDEREGLHRIRVKIPKGLKGSTWQFKLKNVDGSNFAINNFEVLLRELQRIV